MRSPETEEESSFWDAAFFAAVGGVALEERDAKAVSHRAVAFANEALERRRERDR